MALLEIAAELGIMLGLVSPLYLALFKIYDKLGKLCERVSAEETKSKFYHED